jgi:hypothetical protein
MSGNNASSSLIPEEIKARRRKQSESADRQRENYLDAQKDRCRLVNAGNLVADIGDLELELKADKEYLAGWIKAMATYQLVLSELDQKAEKLEQTDKNHWEQWVKVVVLKRSWLDRLKQPPAGVQESLGDAWEPAVNIFLAAKTDPGRVVRELADLAATDPGFAISVAGCLRRGIRPVAEGYWSAPVAATGLLPTPVESEATEPTPLSVGEPNNGAEEPPSPAIIPMPVTVDLASRTVTLGDTTYDVGSLNALRWVKVLAEHPGDWISSTDLKDYDGELQNQRTDRWRKSLPDSILSLIDSETGKGSRIRLRP